MNKTELRWFALVLLAISACINMADRGSLAVAAHNMSAELHLNAKQLGYLLGAFSLTYAVAQIFSGRLIDRWNVNWVYAFCLLLWSMATALHGLVQTFGAILMFRLLLGVSESVAYPSYSKIIAISFPERFRGTANSLIDAGSKVGPALGILLGVKMIDWFSWRGMFFVMGAAGFIWLLPWSFVAGRLLSRPVQPEQDKTRPPSLAEVVGQPSFWGTAIGLFGGNYLWFMLLNWLPLYFETERHYRHSELAFWSSMPFWVLAFSSIAGGTLADFAIRRRGRPTFVRRSFIAVGLLGGCAFLLPAILVADRVVANVFMFLAALTLGLWSSNVWAFTQLLSGPLAAGRWTGMQNAIGNLAGALGQVISGHMLQETHSFIPAFSLAFSIVAVTVACLWFLAGREQPVAWNAAEYQN